MRQQFNQVFQEHNDGTIEPLRRVNINGVIFDRGVRFTSGVAFGGVDIHKFKGWDMEVDEVDGILIIRGFYPPQ